MSSLKYLVTLDMVSKRCPVVTTVKESINFDPNFGWSTISFHEFTILTATLWFTEFLNSKLLKPKFFSHFQHQMIKEVGVKAAYKINAYKSNTYDTTAINIYKISNI